MPSRFFRYDAASGQVVETAQSKLRMNAKWPLNCEALAVDPSQIKEARDFDRANGVPTDYTRDGSPIMRDAGHYRRYRRLHGYHFRNGYES